MIHPIILWQLARNGVGLELPRRRRRWRPLRRPGRRRAIEDPAAPPRMAADPPPAVTVTRPMTAPCNAPNCVGHRTKA